MSARHRRLMAMRNTRLALSKGGLMVWSDASSCDGIYSWAVTMDGKTGHGLCQHATTATEAEFEALVIAAEQALAAHSEASDAFFFTDCKSMIPWADACAVPKKDPVIGLLQRRLSAVRFKWRAKVRFLYGTDEYGGELRAADRVSRARAVLAANERKGAG